MASTRISNSSSEPYAADFKLRVVLDFIQKPKRKRKICEENGISEDLLDQWHREFLQKAESVFSEPSQPVAPAETPTKEDRVTRGEVKQEPQVVPVPSRWGIKLNRGYRGSYLSPSSSKECPSWARGYYRKEWESESGLVVWDDGSQKMERLWAGEALRLLEKLRQDDHWRMEGFPVTRIVRHQRPRQEPQLESKRKTSRKKKNQAPEPVAEEAKPEEKAKPEYEDVEEEIIRLNPQGSVELFDFLRQHELLLKEMAEEEEKRRQEAFSQVYKILFRGFHERQAQEADLSKRSLPWVHHAETHTLVCDTPPNRGTVQITKDGWFWEACIERPDRFKDNSPYFFELEEALGWTEKELLSAEEEAKEKEESVESETSTKSQIDLTPYRIDPTALEPARITYRVVIYLERVPEQFKTMEMSFGKLMRYDETYPSLLKVLNELKLDESMVKFEQPGGLNFGWYFLFSTATYYEEAVARAQAQKLWEASTIQRLYKEEKVTRARFGIEEVETNFCTWLGAVEDPKHPWVQPKTRSEHMANLAMQETIAYALDVVRFREDRKLSLEDVSDEKLLRVLHERRVRSKHIPIEARAESERWLADHAKDE